MAAKTKTSHEGPKKFTCTLKDMKAIGVIKLILLALLGLAAGHWMGKSGIDSLVDANVMGFLRMLLLVGVCVIAGILFAVFDTKARVGWIAAVILCAAGFLFGFFFYPFHNSNGGLNVKWDESVGEIIPDLVFDETRAETGYDLYLPTQKTEDGTYALVLYIHGGGFTSGSKEDGAVWCKYMTAKGYVSASINYTLQSEENPSNLHLMSRQVLQCVKAIHTKSAELGYPVTEMAVSGGSAGGAIALLFAYGLAKESPIPLKFIFEQTGPVSFDPIWWGATNNDYAMQAMFVSNFSGEEVTVEMVERGEHLPIVDAMSPAALVREDTVPTLCAYGPRDKMVPACLKYHLFAALERYHVPYDYVEYPNSNHGLYDDPKSQKEFLEKLDEYCERYFTY